MQKYFPHLVAGAIVPTVAASVHHSLRFILDLGYETVVVSLVDIAERSEAFAAHLIR